MKASPQKDFEIRLRSVDDCPPGTTMVRKAYAAPPCDATLTSEAINIGVGDSPDTGSHPRASTKSLVLVIEDNPADADLVADYFEDVASDTYVLHHVATLEEAMSALAQQSFLMAVADLSLPDARGLEVVERLCATAPQMAIVVLTGLDDEAVALQAVQIGAQDYLVKGRIDHSTLLRAIRYAVERKRAEQQLAYLARFDVLTGLANRAYFQERLAHQIALSKRTKESFAVIFLDLDRFKAVNDSMGHDAGDKLLKEVGARLMAGIRTTDTVARLGGDEFAVIIEGPVDEATLGRVGARIRERLSAPFELSGCDVPIKGSMGVAIWPTAGESVEEILKSADTAMYSAKKSGDGEACVYTEEPLVESAAGIPFEQAVRKAVKEREFSLHYQPQISLRTRQVIGFEALMRWNPEGQPPVPPSRFIPVLEATGLIVDMGYWVLEASCRQLREWHDMGLTGLRMAVNVSARQFEHGGLVEAVEGALRNNQIAPEQLELELTESVLMRDTESTIRTLSALRDLGVRVSIDDFGTGYSCLAYLQRFVVDAIKIDRSFVRTIGAENGHVLADAILSIGATLGIDVVAEGVETFAQTAHFVSKGCPIAQGFYFGRPAPAWTAEEVRALGQTLPTQDSEQVHA